LIIMVATRLFSGLLVLALVGAVPTYSIADTPSLEELAAGMADTADEHKAVASYYRGKAAEARAEADRHRRMASAYGGGKYVEREGMKDHCAGLATSFESVAKQYDALAAAHEASAK